MVGLHLGKYPGAMPHDAGERIIQVERHRAGKLRRPALILLFCDRRCWGGFRLGDVTGIGFGRRGLAIPMKLEKEALFAVPRECAKRSRNHDSASVFNLEIQGHGGGSSTFQLRQILRRIGLRLA